MNLRQLHYLLAIADEGSFTRASRAAARRPTVAIATDQEPREKSSAVHCWNAYPKGFDSQPPARRSYPRPAPPSRTPSARGATLGARLGLQAGELEVATVTSVAFGVLPPAFERWRAPLPRPWRSRFASTRNRRALDDAVRIGVGDIAVGPRPPQWPGPHRRTRLGGVSSPSSQPPTRWPRASVRSRSKNWRNATGCYSGPGHGLSELILENLYARGGSRREEPFETGQVAAAAHLAAAGLGVTIVPDNVVPAGLHAAVRSLKSPLVRQLVAFYP